MKPDALRYFTTLSAPCFVRVNTRARLKASSPSKPCSMACLSRVGQKITLWRMRSAVDDTGATATSTGLLSRVDASLAMAGGMVAEKNRLWRFFGSRLTIFWMSRMKPRSSMRSASSSTKTPTSSRVRARWFRRSMRRPGVATTMSTPGAQARICRPTGTPPKTSVVENRRNLA